MELISMIFSFLKLRTLKTDQNEFFDTLQLVKYSNITFRLKKERCLFVAVCRDRNAFFIQAPYEYPA